MQRCVRYFGIFDYEKIWAMSWQEYLFLWQGYCLRQEDESEKIHLQAWLTMAAKGQKKKGKDTVTAFPAFSDFYRKKEVKENPSVFELAERFAQVGKEE